MTVAELIQRLETLTQDKEVNIYDCITGEFIDIEVEENLSFVQIIEKWN